MKYEHLTLDYDYYMVKMLQKHQASILQLLKSCCNNIKVLETQKGLNIIAEFKQPQELDKLLMLRLFCFDDIFRVRNEIDKALEGQPHRINRIWLSKNGYEKSVLFEGKTQEITDALFTSFIELVEVKRPKKEERKQ